MVESLTQRTKSWEEERGLPFMFDGVWLQIFPSYESVATDDSERLSLEFRA